MIQGVQIKTLNKIVDERGSIMHMLRSDDPNFEKFGEIYFSSVYPGVVKGWHLHSEMTLNYAVVTGLIKLVLFDGRSESTTKDELMEIYIGDDNYSLVTIPNGIWNGFKGIGVQKAIVANCSTLPHRKDEIKRMDPFKNSVITYDWNLVCS